MQNHSSVNKPTLLQDSKRENEADKQDTSFPNPQLLIQRTMVRALRCSFLRLARRTRARLNKLETQQTVLSRQLSDRHLASERIDDLRNRLSSMETHYISQIDEKFDADVYRKALVNYIREYAFWRIVRTIGLFTLLLNAGISVYVYNQIREVTRETVIEQAPTLISDSEEVVRDNLIALLKDSRNGDELARQQIESKPKSVEMIKELIAPRSLEEPEELASFNDSVERQKAILAIDYAGKTKEPELLEALFEVFNADTIPLEVRDKALQALLQYSANDPRTLERVLLHVEEESESTDSFSVSIVRNLSTFNAGRNNGDVNSIMQQGFLSNDTEAIKSAVIYFILNAEQWQDGNFSLKPSKNILFDQGKLSDDGELVKLLIKSSRENSSRTNQDEASAALQDRLSSSDPSLEDGNQENSQGFTKQQLQEIQKYFALALLRIGNQSAFDAFVNDYFYLPSNLQYYTPEEWTTQIIPLFPESDELFSITPTGIEEEQDQFIEWYYYNTPLQWNEASGEYEKLSEQGSIEQLQQGNPEPFIAWMSSGYYEKSNWLAKVHPLFPDAKALFTGTPTGTNDEQDNLWLWVKENSEQLRWDDEQGQYQLIVSNP